MPTQIYEVTDTPVNLLSAVGVDGQPLDLEIGKRYIGRYTAIGPQSILKALEVTVGAAVTPDRSALPVRVFEDLTTIPVTGQSIFVWSLDRGGGQLIINII